MSDDPKKQRKVGRPSSYSTETATAICELISAGSSVTAAAAEFDIPQRTVFGWLAQESEFQQKYACARERRADARFESADKVVQDMRLGLVDAAQARVQIDTIKWQCGKESPKRYGERLELAGEVNSNITVTVADVLRERRAKRGIVDTAPVGIEEGK